MVKVLGSLLGLAFAAISATAAQQQDDTTPFERGQELYRANCAICHQESGNGSQPIFPALNGNDLLGNTARITRTIQQGANRMPPFPNLTAEDISSLATYIRSAWTNNWGAVTAEDVAGTLEDSEELARLASVWGGVFTATQADRGQAVYAGSCGLCHGRRLNGAPDDPDMVSTPPLARARFLRVWAGRSLATLYEYTRATMPEDNPNSLTDQEYVDVIAYMLTVGGMPAGEAELRPNLQSLARVLIQPQQ